jgi:hypothetical protein
LRYIGAERNWYSIVTFTSGVSFMRKGTQPTQGLLRVILAAFGVIAATVASANVAKGQDPIKILGSNSQPANWTGAELDPALAHAKSMLEQGNAKRTRHRAGSATKRLFSRQRCCAAL